MSEFWGHPVDHYDAQVSSDSLLSCAFDLIVLLGAGHDIPARWARKQDHQFYGIMFGCNYEIVLHKKLLEFSIAFRAAMDWFAKERFRNDLNKMPLAGNIKYRGKMREIDDREACNKIIHSVSIEFEKIEKGDEAPFYMVGDILYRYTGRARAKGSKSEIAWIAEIDLLKLPDAAYVLTHPLDF